MDQHVLMPIAKPLVTNIIVERITEFILKSGFKVGDKLPSERELMTRLSVGRSTLREAIKILQAMGMVKVSVGEGMFVGSGETSILTQPLTWSVLMSGAGAKEIIESRRIIEVELAGLAAERASEEAIAELQAVLESLKKRIEEDTPGPIIDLDFHLTIARAAGNILLEKVLFTLHGILQALITESLKRLDRTGRLASELAEIIPIFDAIRDHDPPRARDMMNRHLLATEERFTSIADREEMRARR